MEVKARQMAFKGEVGDNLLDTRVLHPPNVTGVDGICAYQIAHPPQCPGGEYRLSHEQRRQKQKALLPPDQPPTHRKNSLFRRSITFGGTMNFIREGSPKTALKVLGEKAFLHSLKSAPERFSMAQDTALQQLIDRPHEDLSRSRQLPGSTFRDRTRERECLTSAGHPQLVTTPLPRSFCPFLNLLMAETVQKIHQP